MLDFATCPHTDLEALDGKRAERVCLGCLAQADKQVWEALAGARKLLASCRTLLDQCADTFELESGPEREAVKKCRRLVEAIDSEARG